jgi:hypothetical protein
VLPGTEVSYSTEKLSRGSGAADLPSLKLGRRVPIVEAACWATLAEDVMIHLRAGSASPPKIMSV